MNEAKKELDDALAMLGTILVSGDAVDVMAAAKSKIRKAYSMLEKEANKDG